MNFLNIKLLQIKKPKFVRTWTIVKGSSENLDIVQLLKKNITVVPFHSDNNPSFAVNKKTGLWLSWNAMKKVIGIIY